MKTIVIANKKNITNTLTVKKNKFYNKTVVFKNLETLDVNLVSYPGLSAVIEMTDTLPIVNVTEGILPDGSFVKSKKGVVGDKKYAYLINREKLAITNNNCILNNNIASNFSANNYIKINKPMPVINTIELTLKIKYNNLSAHNTLLYLTEYHKHISIHKSGVLAIWDTQWVQGKTNLKSNQWYWIRIVKTENDTNFNYYLLADNDTYTLDTLPSIEKWSNEFTSTTDLFSNSEINIGRNGEVTSEHMTGEIDLNNIRIICNTNIFFDINTKEVITETEQGILDEGFDKEEATQYNMYTLDNDIQLSLKDNIPLHIWCGNVTIPTHTYSQRPLICDYVKNGDVKIQNTTLYNFNENNNLTKNITTIAENTNYEFICKISYKNGGGWQVGFGTGPKRFQVIKIHSYTNLGMYCDNFGDNGTFNPVENKWYWINVKYDSVSNTSTQYILEDNGVYTLDTLPEISTWTNNTSINTGFLDTTSENFLILGGNPDTQYSQQYWNGKIDLKNTVVKTKDTILWKPLIEIK